MGIKYIFLLALLVLPLVSSADVGVNVLSNSQVVEPGSQIQFTVNISDGQPVGERETVFYYSIIYPSGKEVLNKEIMQVDNKAFFTKTLLVEDNAGEGYYTISVFVRGTTATSTFKVEEQQVTKSDLYLIILFFSGAIISLFVASELHKINKTGGTVIFLDPEKISGRDLTP